MTFKDSLKKVIEGNPHLRGKTLQILMARAYPEDWFVWLDLQPMLPEKRRRLKRTIVQKAHRTQALTSDWDTVASGSNSRSLLESLFRYRRPELGFLGKDSFDFEPSGALVVLVYTPSCGRKKSEVVEVNLTLKGEIKP